MVENPVDYASKKGHILHSIIDYFNIEKHHQTISADSSSNDLESMNKDTIRSLLTTSDTTESWIIGLHGDSLAQVDKNRILSGYKDLFEANRMYTIILGTKINKDLETLLIEEPDPTMYYYQYGKLHLENLKFISGLLKMQKYKDTHFLFTERIL